MPTAPGSSTPRGSSTPAGRRRTLARWSRPAARWGGLALHLLLGVFPFAFTGLLAPTWAVGVVAVWWLLLAGVALRLQRRSPWLVPLVPVAALAGWVAFLTFGDLALGWTA